MIKFVAIYLATVAFCLAQADTLDDLVAASSTKVKPFTENHVGYDLHADIFYFQDKKVDSTLKCSAYVNTKLTMAGMRPDVTRRTTEDAVHPFVVAQKAANSFGSLSSRFDIRENINGHQFIGLFQGNDGKYVVNKLRAHLMRRVANGIAHYLPALDKAEGAHIELLQGEIESMITSMFRETDESIMQSMSAKDSTSASGSVVIVTNKYVIVAHVGQGSVIAYDSVSNIHVLSQAGKLDFATASDVNNVFGNKKAKSAGCRPNVSFHRRNFEDEDGDPADLQFVVVMGPTVSSQVNNEEAVKMFLNQVTQYRYKPEHEQELYSAAATNILRTAQDRVSFKLTAADHAVIIVGLETDYTQIH